MRDNNNWYAINDVDQLDSPALVVYPDRVKKNIKTAIEMAGDVDRLRPHIKTHKSPEVVGLMIASGINKFKCATIAEAEVLGMKKAKDVLLAYQPSGPKIKRLGDLIAAYPGTNYSCLVDNNASALEQSSYFSQNGFKVPVYIDLNVGMNRTGIVPGQTAIDLYKYCHSLEGIRPIGLHAYDGQIRNVDFNIRKADCDEVFRPVGKMRSKLIEMGFPVAVIAGGSHSFPVHSQRKDVECSPGTFVYWDKGNADYCPEQAFLPAALLISRIISIPSEDKVCIDLGHKSVSAENEISKRVFFLNAPEFLPLSQSEEHLVLEAPAGHGFQPGDILYGLPYHICPTVALYERMIVINNGRLDGEWTNLARNRQVIH